MATVRTRKRGKTWSYSFEAGQINGKRKIVEKGGFATQQLAYNAGVEAYTDFRHGNIGITSEAITLKDFMTSWLEEVVSLNVKANTLQCYQSRLTKQIIPQLGGVKVQELTPAILDKWIRSLQREGLSYNSISSVHALLHHALDYAVNPGQLINSNPAEYIKVPKSAPKKIVKRHIISHEQFNSLLERNPFGTQFYIPILLLYYTGMRLGEVLGLSWSDIDFATKRINLRRQIVPINRRGHFATTLKTESSRRYILLSEELLNELRRWQGQQAADEELIGDSYVYTYVEGDGHIVAKTKSLACSAERLLLVCTQKNGLMVYRVSMMKALRAVGLNAHSFRHTHATQLIESGAQAKGVAERLGHANALITQNLYTHNTLKLQEETLAIFDKILQTKG